MALVGRHVVASVPQHRVRFMVRAITSNTRCIHQLTRDHTYCSSMSIIYNARPHRQQQQQRRVVSSEIPGGVNLFEETSNNTKEERPKIILEAYGPTGFDVSNMIQKVDLELESLSGTVHMTGSIFAFPRACFLWKMERAEQITLESLAPVMVHRPMIKYLFLGCNTPIPFQELKRIKTELKSNAGIVAEQLTLVRNISVHLFFVYLFHFWRSFHCVHSVNLHFKCVSTNLAQCHGNVQYFEWRRQTGSSCLDLGQERRSR